MGRSRTERSRESALPKEGGREVGGTHEVGEDVGEEAQTADVRSSELSGADEASGETFMKKRRKRVGADKKY